MTRRLAIPILLLSLCLSAFAADPPLAKRLPKTGKVKGFKIYPKTLQYARGDGLTDIYDGGYEVYTKHGVIEAVTQVYTNGKTNITVTLHTMTSPQAAKSFLAYWKHESAGMRLKSLKIGNGAFYYTADGATNGYLISGRYFATVMATAADKQAQSSAVAFMKLLAKRAK